MTNILETLYTLAAGRRPTGRNPGELFINMADRIIGYTDEAGVPVDLPGRPVVGTMAPQDPMPGDLWFDTNAPGALKLWRSAVLGWVGVGGSGGGGSATHVGDTPPTSPVDGQLWFRTAAPVGLFVWLNDGNSSQWVQTQGGGSFSQTGRQSVAAVGLTDLNFDQVPTDALWIRIAFNNLVNPAGATLRFDYAGFVASYAGSRQLLGAAYAQPIDNPGAGNFVLDVAGATNVGYFGTVNLDRVATIGHAISGNFRRTSTEMITVAGRVLNLPTDGTPHFPRVASTAAFTAGGVSVSWGT